MLKQIVITLLLILFVSECCFAVSTYKGLQPGRSTRADVEKAFGQPLGAISESIYEYRVAESGGKLFVEYRSGTQVIERIERQFAKPISRAALLRSLNLSAQPEENGVSKEGKLQEFFGDIKTLVLTYASKETNSGVISLGYYSMELFEKSIGSARNPQVQFNPTDCRDIFLWAQSEKELAKRSKDIARYQAILELLIIAQRGDCDNARSLHANYKQRYRVN